jgi:hypothetical protein
MSHDNTVRPASCWQNDHHWFELVEAGRAENDAMRLTNAQIATISTTSAVLGAARGSSCSASRLHDQQKGGDVDFVEMPSPGSDAKVLQSVRLA